MTVTKEQAREALDWFDPLDAKKGAPDHRHYDTLRQFIEQSQDSGHAPAPTDELRRVGLFSRGQDGRLCFHEGHNDPQRLANTLTENVTGGPYSALAAYAGPVEASASLYRCTECEWSGFTPSNCPRCAAEVDVSVFGEEARTLAAPAPAPQQPTDQQENINAASTTQAPDVGVDVAGPVRSRSRDGQAEPQADATEGAKAIARLKWLHSPGSHNVDSWEWGIFRVRWIQGNTAEVLQTGSDFSDLDAAMGGVALSGAAPTAQGRGWDATEWSRYIAGVIDTYLSSENAVRERDRREDAIAGIISRRIHWLAGAAPTPQPELTVEQIDAALAEIDSIARDFNHYDYGLPLHSPDDEESPIHKLRAAVRAMLGAAPTQAPQQPVAYTKLAEYEVMAGCYHLSEPAAQWTRKLPEGKYVICATSTEAA